MARPRLNQCVPLPVNGLSRRIVWINWYHYGIDAKFALRMALIQKALTKAQRLIYIYKYLSLCALIMHPALNSVYLYPPTLINSAELHLFVQ